MKILNQRSVLVLFFLILFVSSQNVLANTIPVEAVYDLEKGGVQEFFVQNRNGEICEVTIEEIRANRISNGSYKVTYRNPGSWDAGFYVTISNNQITKAYSPFNYAYVGKIKLPVLTKNTNLKATYSFVFEYNLINYQTGVVAKILDSELIVSQK